MIHEDLIGVVEKIIRDKILKITNLSGGDTSEVYKITCSKKSYVVKTYSSDTLVQSEVDGLALISKSGSFRTPKVLAEGAYESNSYLVLEYIEQGSKDTAYWVKFWKSLAQLHTTTQDAFGYHQDNYIGPLRQRNLMTSQWSDFYITQRLQPQFIMAEAKGYSFNDKDKIYTWIDDNIIAEVPCLIHGDLWAGNLLATSNGSPCLIDPAVCYASREMDIAMMKLFGGFDFSLFKTYQDICPLSTDWERRVPLYQLYYILVHVNIFGKGYYNQALNIIKGYS